MTDYLQWAAIIALSAVAWWQHRKARRPIEITPDAAQRIAEQVHLKVQVLERNARTDGRL